MDCLDKQCARVAHACTEYREGRGAGQHRRVDCADHLNDHCSLARLEIARGALNRPVDHRRRQDRPIPVGHLDYPVELSPLMEFLRGTAGPFTCRRLSSCGWAGQGRRWVAP